ncbi:MAG: hypothetical protein ISS66_14160 [Desulfobacteraceae bacterium]|nr:hypothetical protein [Desulfobacteraceae bacterium]
MKILEILFHLDLIESTMPDPSLVALLNPRTIDEAIDALIAELPLRNKTAIANMMDEELMYLRPTLGVKGERWFQNDLWLNKSVQNGSVKNVSIRLMRFHEI